MNLKKIVLILVFFKIVNCYADEFRYCDKFRSANNLYEFRISAVRYDSIKIDGVYRKDSTEKKWGLFNRVTKKKLFEIETVAL